MTGHSRLIGSSVSLQRYLIFPDHNCIPNIPNIVKKHIIKDNTFVSYTIDSSKVLISVLMLGRMDRDLNGLNSLNVLRTLTPCTKQAHYPCNYHSEVKSVPSIS